MIRESDIRDYLCSPDWSSVRPVYKKLSDEFRTLTDPYKIFMSERRRMMLDHLILTIDEVDIVVDRLPTKAERDSITLEIVRFIELGGQDFNHKSASDELLRRIEMLSKIIAELQIEDRFLTAAGIIFNNTEDKRSSLSCDDIISMVMCEGAATAELPLSIMGVDATTHLEISSLDYVS